MIEITNNNKKIENILHAAPAQSHHRENDANKVYAKIDVRLHQMIQQAVQQVPDQSKVEEARKLLASNQLDTPENIRKAAENLIKQGL